MSVEHIVSTPTPTHPPTGPAVSPTVLVPGKIPDSPDISAAGTLSTPARASTMNHSDTSVSTPTATATDPPTPTNTPTATATDAPTPTSTPTATPTDAPTPTNTPTTLPTEISLPDGWLISNIRVSTNQFQDSVVLFGNLGNHTGISQELAYIFGIFYDAQGQVIADQNSTTDYWPINFIPPGGEIPFELTVADIQTVANFDLGIKAEPSDETLRQDFEFSGLDQSNEGGGYCVTGRLRNPGDPLEQNLTIVAVLYDDQDTVVNFGDYFERQPQRVIDDETLPFQVCADDLNQSIARYDLQAWGQ
jgi:hypothetical protein